MLYFSFFHSFFCCHFIFMGGDFPRIQVVQRDYLNPTLGSLTGPSLEIRSPRRWDYAICRALNLTPSPPPPPPPEKLLCSRTLKFGHPCKLYLTFKWKPMMHDYDILKCIQWQMEKKMKINILPIWMWIMSLLHKAQQWKLLRIICNNFIFAFFFA